MAKRRREVIDTELLDLPKPQKVQPQRIAFSPKGMVSTQHYLATEAGVRILAEGGNAIDAAVAAALALGVCEPQASGLGGQTMMLVHRADPRQNFALDGSSRVPNRMTREAATAKERRIGHRATTVPSTPAVLAYANERYGALPFDQVLDPAIEIAERGFPVSELFHALSKRELKNLQEGNAGSVFLRGGKRPFPVGSVIRQEALAATLRHLATAGVEDFYTGEIGRTIHEDMEARGGLLHQDDLAQIPWPVERKPLSTRFDGSRLISFPPPGAGRTLFEMMHILEEFPKTYWNPDTPRGARTLVEVIRRGAVDRRDRPYDPTLYPQVEERSLTNRDYAKLAAGQIRRRVRRKIKTNGETTHLSVMDAEGNVVALTQSIERVFGSFTMTPELGFLYNNYMTAFEYEDMTHPYYMRPNAVPWASVAPTIVFRGSRPWLAIGSPGSERIVSAVLQVLLRLQNHSPYDAVAAPRLHCSVKGRVSIEASRFRDDIPVDLARRGFEIDARDAFSFYMGCVQLVMRERDGFVGVADPRRDGSAGGPR